MYTSGKRDRKPGALYADSRCMAPKLATSYLTYPSYQSYDAAHAGVNVNTAIDRDGSVRTAPDSKLWLAPTRS